MLDNNWYWICWRNLKNVCGNSAMRYVQKQIDLIK